MQTINKKQNKKSKIQRNCRLEICLSKRATQSLFQHDMNYGAYKNLPRKNAYHKVLHIKPVEIASNLQYDGYQRWLASIVYNFSTKNLKALLLTQEHRLLLKINKWLMNNTSPSVEDLRNAKYFFSRAKIWYTDLADIQLISKYNMEERFLLCVIDICSKYSWDVILKYKKGITNSNSFQKIFDDSCCKPNKVWLDQGSEF